LKKLILNCPSDSSDLQSGGTVQISGKDFHYLVHVRRVRPGSVFKASFPDGKEFGLIVVSVSKNTLLAKSLEPAAASSTGSAAAAAVAAGSTVAATTAAAVTAQVLAMPPIYLFQSMLKGMKMDLVIRQAAETGVTGIIPFVSEFSQIKINKPGQSGSGGNASGNTGRTGDSSGKNKVYRWERIIREARQQSDSMIATFIKEPCDLAGLLDYWETLKKEHGQRLG